MPLIPPVLEWTCAEVQTWMHEQGFSRYVDIFTKQHLIDGPALLTLSENDLKSPPLQMKVLGHIKKLALAINKLQAENELESHLPISKQMVSLKINLIVSSLVVYTI